MMLAVLILAVMMAIIYGVVVSTVQAQQRVEEVLLTSEIGPALLSQIREDLESAFLPKDGEFFLAVNHQGATGDRDRVDLVTGRMAYGPARDGEDPAFHSVNEVGYQVQDNRRDPTVGILYRREDFFLDNEPLKGGRLVELYDRVRHFDVQFWNGTRWLPDWSSKREKNKLPKAVKVELRLVVDDREDKDVEQAFTTIITFPR
jgi:type II secretory pathway component PulJ